MISITHVTSFEEEKNLNKLQLIARRHNFTLEGKSHSKVHD